MGGGDRGGYGCCYGDTFEGKSKSCVTKPIKGALRYHHWEEVVNLYPHSKALSVYAFIFVSKRIVPAFSTKLNHFT